MKNKTINLYYDSEEIESKFMSSINKNIRKHEQSKKYARNNKVKRKYFNDSNICERAFLQKL